MTAWSDIWDTAGNSSAYGVAYGGDHFYAVGSVSYDAQGDMIICKYSLDGTLVWFKKYDIFSFERGVRVTYFNNKIFVSGWFEDGTGTKDGIVFCFDEDGNEIWHRTIISADYNDFAKDMVIYDNHLYVAIQRIATGLVFETKIIKFDLDGKYVSETSGPLNTIMDLDLVEDKIYAAGSADGAAGIAIYDRDLNFLGMYLFSSVGGYKVTDFFGIEAVKEGSDYFIYVAGFDEENVYETIVAKLTLDMETVWAIKIENCRGEGFEVHYGFPVVVGDTSKGTPALRNFYMVKISPEGEIMYEKIWGGDGRDYLYEVAFCRGYICVVGTSDSYTASYSGVVWCLKAEYTLQVELPYEKLKWLIFYKGFILPAGGGYGSGSATLPEADYAVVVDEKFEEEDTRWIFDKWSDGIEDSTREIRLFEDIKLKALYKKQYKITVESGYGTATGSGWYDEGATATVSVSPTQVQLGDNKIAVFKGWLKNGEFVSEESTLVVSVTEPATYTATWEIKTITVKTYTVSAVSPYGTISGIGVYGEGATATVSINPTVVDHGNGTRHVFEGWVKNGELISTDPSYSFEVTEDVHLKARWKTEYLVEVYSEYGTVSGGGWYEKGAKATISVSPTEVEAEEKTLVFKGWYLEGQLASKEASYSFTVDSPKSFTAEWTTKEIKETVEEYTIELISRYGETKGAGTYPEGTIVEISITPTTYEKDGTRYTFTGWYFQDGTLASKEPMFNIKVTKDEKIYAKWAIEYKVEVYSRYGTVSGAGWYRAGSKASISVSPTKVEKNGVQYVFEGWMDENGRMISTSPTYTFTVNRPTVLVAKWTTSETISLHFNFTTIIMVVAFTAAILVLLLIIILIKKKK
ncbi:MAG: hypothetical protein DRJ38_05970 [Thermoprotei archaeon]|nr:MAG: hypothetical protein DRJ38_05970 [Thermoprotei archaeon]